MYDEIILPFIKREVEHIGFGMEAWRGTSSKSGEGVHLLYHRKVESMFFYRIYPVVKYFFVFLSLSGDLVGRFVCGFRMHTEG